MSEVEQGEFRKSLTVSVIGHAVLLTVAVWMTWTGTHLHIEPADLGGGSMNVMWARTVSRPKATAPNKLPAPVVQPAPPKAAEKPKVVMEEKATAKTSKAKSDDDLRKAMDAAVSSVEKSLAARPTPRPDNFPSDGKGEAEGVPAGPDGGTGILGGDPVLSAYRAQVRQIIMQNFIWIQKDRRLQAHVSFQIHEDGTVVNAEVARTSGNVSYDQAALRAVKKSSPLPAPPQDLAPKIVRQKFIVDFKPGAQ